MLGAIAGDVIGSVYEGTGFKSKDFPLFGRGCRFTDDTVCTIAVADALLSGGDFAQRLRHHARRHPARGYGGMFADWVQSTRGPYGSWGNGAAMRVSAIPALAADLDEALILARRSAAATHDHPDALRGAEAVVFAMWRARDGAGSATIRDEVAGGFGYDLRESIDAIRPGYAFDLSCAGTVPPAIVCALEATGYEDAIRNAVSLGGDADTLACITGGLAETLFGLPIDIAEQARAYLTPDLRAVLDRFVQQVAG